MGVRVHEVLDSEASGCLLEHRPYNVSKWAVEALADNYRVELSGFGVDSVIVEPGAYPTDFSARLLQPSDGDRLESLGEFANTPAQWMERFGEQLAGDNAPKPQAVADAVAKLIDTPAGERPFRTVVDQLGMGEAIEPYNQQAESVTAGIYEAFGMSDQPRRDRGDRGDTGDGAVDRARRTLDFMATAEGLRKGIQGPRTGR
jgi:hypothetical protein